MSRLGVEFSDDELEEMVNRSNIDMYSKAELPQVSILFRTQGLILCSKKKILGVKSRDFSQADKKITAAKLSKFILWICLV